MRRLLYLLPLLVLACGEEDTGGLDPNGALDGAILDVGRLDASSVDTGVPQDAGVPDSGVPRDGGQSQCAQRPDCDGCCQDGDPCTFSINCQPGSICNVAGDALYDPSKPDNVCVQVLCTSDADCDPGKVCGAGQLCIVSGCRSDSDCASPDRCLAGACGPVPTIDQCVLIPRAIALAPGATAPVELLALSGGRGVPTTQFRLTIGAAPGVVDTNGPPMTAGPTAGPIELTAEISGIQCANSMVLQNYGSPALGTTRVVVSSERRGAPISGAEVTLSFANGEQSGVTDVLGLYQVSDASPLTAVTARAPGYATVTVLNPGIHDLVLELPPFDPTRTAGLYGHVDISALSRQDFRFGTAGAAFPARLEDFGLSALLSQPIPTLVDAPELGFPSEVIDLPGSLTMGVGGRQLTGDLTRCQGPAGPADFLSCYVARTEGPYGAVYSMATQLRLGDVAAIAGEAGLFTLVAPSRGSLGQALRPYVEFGTPAPFVSDLSNVDCSDPAQLADCHPSYGDFDLSNLVAEAVPRTEMIVDLSDLLANSACDRDVSLVALVELPGRGLVPIGYASARQRDDLGPSCQLAASLPPFAPANLGANELAISIAALHQGAEGHPVHLVATARRIVGGSTQPYPLQMVVVHRPQWAPRVRLSGAPIPVPQATVEAALERFTLDSALPAQVLKLELLAPGDQRVIYAPATVGTFLLPPVAGVLGLQEASELRISAARTVASYPELFNLGSGRTLEFIEGVLDASAQTVCQSGPGDCRRL